MNEGKISKKEAVYRALLSGQKITPLDQEGKPSFGTTRLADIIFRLKKEGFPIVTKKIEVKDRFGNICYVAEYSMDLTPINPGRDLCPELNAGQE